MHRKGPDNTFHLTLKDCTQQLFVATKRLPDVVLTPVSDMWLYLKDRRGAASLRHRNRAATIARVCEQKPYMVWISWRWKSYLVQCEHCLNRPLPSSKNPHFQNEARCTTFLVKMSFISMRMKNDFHIKGWALNLVLKQRPGGTSEMAYYGKRVINYSALWGCAGDGSRWLSKCIVGLFCGTNLPPCWKCVHQNSLTMHFDNHLDLISFATSK